MLLRFPVSLGGVSGGGDGDPYGVCKVPEGGGPKPMGGVSNTWGGVPKI